MNHPYHIPIYLYHDISPLNFLWKFSKRRHKAPSPEISKARPRHIQRWRWQVGSTASSMGFQPPGKWRGFWHIHFDVENAGVMRMLCVDSNVYIYVHIYIYTYAAYAYVLYNIYIYMWHHVTDRLKIIIWLRLLETQYSTFPRKVGHFRCWFV